MLENPSTSCGGTLAASVSAAAGGENVQAAARSAPSRPLPLTTPNFAFMGSLSTMKNDGLIVNPTIIQQGKEICHWQAGRQRVQKQRSPAALRQAGPRLLPSKRSAAKTALLRTSRGTARRAPTEILEQDRPHHIAPVLIGVVVKGICTDRTLSASGILRGDLLKILAGEEVAVADLELKLLFKGPVVVNV